MDKRAVLFDMDGVIVDSELYMQGVLAQFFREETEYPEEKLDLNAFIGSSGEESIWRKVFRQIDGEPDFGELNRRLREYIGRRPIPYASYVMEGAGELFAWLKAEGYRTGLASSSSLASIRRMLGECGFKDRFDCILSGEMFRESKPNPEIYNRLAEKLGVEKKDCVIVEDSHYGIEAGLNAGIDTVALRDTRFGIDQSNAGYFIDSLGDLKGLLLRSVSRRPGRIE